MWDFLHYYKTGAESAVEGGSLSVCRWMSVRICVCAYTYDDTYIHTWHSLHIYKHVCIYIHTQAHIPPSSSPYQHRTHGYPWEAFLTAILSTSLQINFPEALYTCTVYETTSTRPSFNCWESGHVTLKPSCGRWFSAEICLFRGSSRLVFIVALQEYLSHFLTCSRWC